MSRLALIVTSECDNGYGKITASVSSTSVEDLWVVITNTGTSDSYNLGPISNVSGYTFEQGGLPNGYYEIAAAGLISGWAPLSRFAAVNCAGVNSGQKAYRRLEEYFTGTGQPTGNVKSNIPGDPDYIAPETDLNFCPI